ncbi:MmcQ/YjbR family DNA-binding protein [Streptomyces roseifaciens]
MALFQVAGKIFAVLTEAEALRPEQVTLKSDAESALHLREQYPVVSPRFYARLRRWNTVVLSAPRHPRPLAYALPAPAVNVLRAGP